MERKSNGAKPPVRPRHLTAARLAATGAGLAALALGIAQGGYQDTLGKAVRICLECIGIG